LKSNRSSSPKTSASSYASRWLKLGCWATETYM
jgi:hypothetical protein